jgi:O-antigen ligase
MMRDRCWFTEAPLYDAPQVLRIKKVYHASQYRPTARPSQPSIYFSFLFGISFSVPSPGNLIHRLGGLSAPVSLLATLFLSGTASRTTSESGII